MYFVYRDGRYIDAAGASFRSFMDGRLPQLPGERPTLDDWSDHLTTLFPEVRLKRFLEMRGADGGRLRRIVGLPALWAGLLYDGDALAAAWDLVKGWSAEQRQALRDEVPRAGLAARIGTATALDVARRMVRIAHDGLVARARRNSAGADETHHLEIIEEIVDRGQSPADIMLARHAGAWRGDIDQVFEEYAF
jgi:glutamate--cysteine ligase